jgi:uncharacterized surface protein with fasciclin (FAS1) repeats
MHKYNNMHTIISNDYRDNLIQMHTKKSFGASASIPSGLKQAITDYQISSLLDFGCGKGNVVAALKEKYDFNVSGYDPANSAFSNLPETVELIYSSDVLEHIEPVYLAETLEDIAKRASKVMYHIIACHPAKKNLSDGRNAHLIIESPGWWKLQLQQITSFTIVDESVSSSTKILRKGPSIDIVKYAVLMKRNA